MSGDLCMMLDRNCSEKENTARRLVSDSKKPISFDYSEGLNEAVQNSSGTILSLVVFPVLKFIYLFLNGTFVVF